MIQLGLNIDHVATLRQARYREHPRDCGQMVEPDPVSLALLGERAGADGITVHLREDRRHIQESDVERLSECIQTRLNLEMACDKAMVDFALHLQPQTICLVPENREEVTTEGGLDVVGEQARVAECVERLRAAGLSTSLFIDPDPQAVVASAEIGTDMIELHTGAFANAWYDLKLRQREINRLRDSLELGREVGLTVNAGHGINYVNVGELVRLEGFHEFNIGHSIIARSVGTGLEEAVSTMKRLMNPA